MPLLRVTGGPTPPAGLTLANATLEVTFERPYADGTSVHPLVHHAELDTSTSGWKPAGSADGTPFYLPGAGLGDPTPPPVVLTERQEYADETSQRFARRIQAVIETDLGEWAYATAASSLVVVDADELFPYGSAVVDQRTQADATGGVVTFDQVIQSIEIANLDPVNAGVFTVNGFPITVPAGAGYRSPIGGTPSATVTISGATAYEIRRLDGLQAPEAAPDPFAPTTIIVSSAADLEPYLGTDHYDLPADRLVLINGTIDLGNRYVVLGEGTVLRGLALANLLSTATGGVVRAAGLDAAVILREFNVIAPAGPALDLSGPIGQQLNLSFVGLFGAAAGTISGFDVQALKDCYVQAADGLHLTGITNKVYVSACPFYGIADGNAGITLGAELDAEIVDIQSSFFKSETGVAIRAEAGYQVGEGVITDSLVLGATVPFEGLGPSDVQWTFRGNTGVRDSMTAAEVHSTESDTVPIAGVGTPAAVDAASMNGANIERFTSAGDSSITYTGMRPATVLFIATIQVDPAGNNVDGSVYLARNGVPITASAVPFFVASGQDTRTVTIMDLITVETGDVVNVFVSNDTNTTSITVPFLSLVAKG